MLNSALELVGAMAHVLNLPNYSKEGDCIINGHALMQPRIGVGLVESRKSNFSKIFAGMRAEPIHMQMLYQILIKIILAKEFLQEREYMMLMFFIMF